MPISTINNDSFADTAVHGQRNLIINGAMQVAQRGTSQSANGYGSIDRWHLNGASTVTVTQTATTTTETDTLGGIEYYARLVGTSTDSSRQWFQKIEGLKQFANKTVTFSFFAKASSSTTVGLQYGLLGAGNDTYNQFTTREISTSWAKYSATFTVPSMTSGFTFAAGDNMRMAFNIKEANYTLDITGVQLEVGDTATPFEHRSYGDELARCQRYFFKTYAQGTAIGTATTVNCSFLPMHASNSYARTPLNFPVSMRTTPTFVSYNTNNGTSGQVSAGSSNYTASPAALGPDRVSNGVSNVLLGQHAYLTWHCTADAEL